ncbi:MAG: hypothetical protein GY757_33715 [bacterium]|nr:hypothetical protein [bacterium]
MSKLLKSVSFVLGVIFLGCSLANALEMKEEKGKQTIFPDRTREAIKIDGALIEPIWSKPPLSENFISYSPVYGELLKQKTEIWMAYNDKGLYFAFKCHDKEPGKIKTSIAQRDKMFNDDWVGVLLDAMGSKQTNYEFYANPSGIQGDSLNSSIEGTDMAPDFVWESAGKITKEGYQVEIRIPLESIRFKSGKEVKMGILLLRNVSRTGLGAAWPETAPGDTDFNFMATLIYKDLKSGLKLEVLPNFTYNRDVRREDADNWGDADGTTNIGASVKYGITSSITAEATVNPDFSQVESDSFQVETNRRYPIFYSEKRPFFMEGMEVFDFGKVNAGMMVASIHTRHIADPGWAAKLSGSTGKMSFALLTSNDALPGQPYGDGVNPNEGKNATWGVFRGKYNMGSDNSLGVIYTGRYFAGSRNNAAGFDVQYRPFKNARINASYLLTNTKETEDGESQNGNGLTAMFQYIVPKLILWATYERYGTDFSMTSAFINRTGISRGQLFAGPSFYIKNKKLSWLRRIHPHFQFSKLHDLATGMDDTVWRLGVDLNFSFQGSFRVQYRSEKEAWKGQHFDQQYIYLFGQAQLSKWLSLSGSFSHGDGLYYDVSLLGTVTEALLSATIQPSIKSNIAVTWINNKLDNKSGSENYYTVNILNLQTTYQFNKYFFIRAALRYDDYQEKVLTDLLASFTLIPGSVIHLGYGSIFEKKEYIDGDWMPGQGSYTNMRNGLFFKVSYLWQIK